MHRKFFVILFSLVILLTGCWDKVEINKRIFVTAIGIDKIEKPNEEKKGKEVEMFPELIPDRYRIIYAYPNTGMFAGKIEGEHRHTITSTGANMVDIEKNMNTTLGGVTTFDHTKIIVLGANFAKDARMVREVLDHIERSPEIGRRIHFMITSGKADKIIETEIEYTPPIVGLYIRDLIDKPSRMARVVDADFGYILRTLHESNATIIPRIESSENEVKVSGVGVIKDYQLVGWMGEMETVMLMVMLDRVNMITHTLEVDDDIISGTITHSKTDMKVYEKDGKIVISFNVVAEGNLKQHLFMVKEKPVNVEYLNQVEKKMQESAERQIETTFKRIQEEFGADLVQAGEYLRKYEPELWQSVKNDWDEIFSQAELEVKVDLRVRRVGSTK